MKRFLKVLCVILLLGVLVNPSTAMTERQRRECHYIIHASAAEAAASAAALAQLPGSDNIALAIILGKMTLELAKVFNVPLSDAASEIGKNLLRQYAGTITARFTSQWIVGWLPWIGNWINAATMSALVEWVGWSVAENFDRRGRYY